LKRIALNTDLGTRFGLVLIAFVLCLVPAAETSAAPKVVGYVSYWDQARAMQTLSANPGTFSTISPSWFAPGPRGGVIVQEQSVDVDPALVHLAHSQGAKVMPAIANYRDREWSPTVVSSVLNDPELRERHVAAIVDLVDYLGYDGIDVDYEHLPAEDRNALTTFVTELSAAMHAKGKRVSVVVHPKRSEPGPQPKNQAQDYAALGAVADEVRVMLYDHSWETSPPGPVAPLDWVEDVIRFAVTQIPAHKIVLGAPLYGYDWPLGGAGESVMWQDLPLLRLGALPQFDLASSSPWFTYVSGLTMHTVWFENAQSTAAKLALVRRYGLGGVHFWRLGGEDPATWPAVRTAFAGP
jgi:spore germination protein